MLFMVFPSLRFFPISCAILEALAARDHKGRCTFHPFPPHPTQNFACNSDVFRYFSQNYPVSADSAGGL